MTGAPLHPGLAHQYAVHAAVRRDVGRLLAALAPSRPARPREAIVAYWDDFACQLHHHHEIEDTFVWPLMRQRLGSEVTALLDRNLVEHAAMTAAMDAFGTDLTDMRDDPAAAYESARRMAEVIETHLSDEEADVLPLIPQVFTLDDVAVFQAEAVKTNSPDQFLPWVLEEAPEPIATAFAQALPTPVREQLEAIWMPRWQATVDALVVATPAAASQ